MSESSALTADPSPGPSVVQAVVRADGTAEVVVDGSVRRVALGSVAEAGAAVTGLVAEIAAGLGRPVPATVEDPDGVWSLLIHPDGSVEEAPTALADASSGATPAVPAPPPETRAPAEERTRTRTGEHRTVAAAGQAPTLDDLLATRRRTAQQGAAHHGWQAGLRRVTGGLVSPAPGRAERARRGAIESVQRSLDGPKTIVVINPKGGAHKTTATLLMAATFGIHRGGYTLAWDNNETRGTLGWRSTHARHSNTAVNLLQDIGRFTDLASARVGDLDSYVRSQGRSQFDVLASDEDAASAASVDAHGFTSLHTALSRFYRVMVIDTGNNMRASNWQAAIDAADQLVIVSTVREDTAQSAAWAIDALRATGHAEMVRHAVTVLSAPEPKVDKHLRKRLHEHFGALTRAVLDVPHDKRLIPGGPIEYDALHRRTRDAWLQVTATVADGL
ncbi:chromosome partitioning protein [Cellulomonas cellasea]|uniref:MinD-like ATPase involved in chromosome partitioning or flagellar assembly n=1 Tax=Cellulomonas cellasea TaxID=43670 RepID=A0A7W4UJ89_9CELL|nr:chromosome partitioning protein [Cellulomonas cellasea]MBB2924680.1 MinD-like ATPase involved in chromosome partitioning or flagellar assembly [Cellulomonas cellasea]